MNQQLFDALIRLFSEYPLAKLMPDGNTPLTEDTVKLYEAYTGMSMTEFLTDPTYTTARPKIAAVRKMLEYFMNKGHDSRGLLIDCLQYAWGKLAAIEPKAETEDEKWWLRIFEPLCLSTFGKSWSQTQKDFFQDALRQLKENNVYFISYTNRWASFINDDYYTPVCAHFWKQPVTDVDKISKNLLAGSFAEYLKVRSINKGFYDNKSLRISEPIEERLRQQCNSSFFLIQLIDCASFMKNEVNWSYEEYNSYIQNDKKAVKGVFFYITDKNALISKDSIYPDYWNWYDQVTQLKRGDFYQEVKSKGDFVQCLDKLLDEFNVLRRQWFEQAPA